MEAIALGVALGVAAGGRNHHGQVTAVVIVVAVRSRRRAPCKPRQRIWRIRRFLDRRMRRRKDSKETLTEAQFANVRAGLAELDDCDVKIRYQGAAWVLRVGRGIFRCQRAMAVRTRRSRARGAGGPWTNASTKHSGCLEASGVSTAYSRARLWVRRHRG